MIVGVLILAVLAGIAVVWALAAAFAGHFVGASIIRVTIFTGPSFRVGSVGDCEIRIGLLPIGSSVEFLGVDAVEERYANSSSNNSSLEPTHPEDFAAWADVFVGGRTLYENLPLATRLTMHLVGWVPVFVVAQLVLGVREASLEFVEGFGQVFKYLLEKEYAEQAIAWARMAHANGDTARVVATIAMKVLAINLLPVPALAGGELLRQIASSLARRWVRWPEALVNITFPMYLLGLFLFVDRTWRLLAK